MEAIMGLTYSASRGQSSHMSTTASAPKAKVRNMPKRHLRMRNLLERKRKKSVAWRADERVHACDQNQHSKSTAPYKHQQQHAQFKHDERFVTQV